MSRGAQAFPRQERTTSSVRLRKRRDVPAPGRKKNQRHSGDFSFFSARREEESIQVNDCSDNEGDWNYITFPNGVASVHEVRIGLDSSQAQGVSERVSPMKGDLREEQRVSPVKHRSNLCSSHAMSASVFNIREQTHNLAHRKSGDFSQYSSHDFVHMRGVGAREEVRPVLYVRFQSHEPHNSPVYQRDRGARVQADPHMTPTRVTNPVKDKKKEGNTKQCSREFEFKKVNRRSGDFNHVSQVLSHELDKAEEKSIVERMISRELLGARDTVSEGSEESGIFSTGSSQESPSKEVRRPGLGRRAITQINVRDRKNSYNNALAKSQENLVKVQILYCTVLYCTVLCCTVLYCTVVHHTVSSVLMIILI